jgi:hypothetical protein
VSPSRTTWPNGLFGWPVLRRRSSAAPGPSREPGDSSESAAISTPFANRTGIS